MENENVKGLTIFLNNIREDLQDEFDVIRKYEAHADYAEKFGYTEEAKILRDISDEEKVHIGELSSILKKFDVTYEKSLKDGEKEAKNLKDEKLEEDISYLFQEEDLKQSAKEKLEINKELKPIQHPTFAQAKEKLEINKELKPIQHPTFAQSKEKLEINKELKPIQHPTPAQAKEKLQINKELKPIQHPTKKKSKEINEAVTFIDNMGNLKTTSVEKYNKEMHKYDRCISIMNKLIKKRNILKESALPEKIEDREYVFPKKMRFPLFDKAHVLAAIKFFNYAKPSEEEILAEKIKSKMHKYGLTSENVGEENRLKKYL